MSIGQPPNADISPSILQWLTEVANELNKTRKLVYIPATQFSGYFNTSGGTIQSAGIGNPQLVEINSLGIVGLRFNAINDSVHHLFRVPIDFNVDTNLRVQLEWCISSSDISGTVTWGVRYRPVAEDETIAAAITALDTPIAADNVVGSFARMITPSGFIDIGQLNHEDLVHFDITLDAVSGLNPVADQIILLGLLLNDEE